jgi:hypothetical protein
LDITVAPYSFSHEILTGENQYWQRQQEPDGFITCFSAKVVVDGSSAFHIVFIKLFTKIKLFPGIIKPFFRKAWFDAVKVPKVSGGEGCLDREDSCGGRQAGCAGFFLPSRHHDGKDSNPRLWLSVYSIDRQGCT